jgi:hypothetical protein
MSTSTRAASSAVSGQDSCEKDDVTSGCPIGEERKMALEKKKGVDKSKGLKNAKGNRPGKKARERYQTIVAELVGMVRQDPLLSLEDIQIQVPLYIQDNKELNAKLVARLKKEILTVC